MRISLLVLVIACGGTTQPAPDAATVDAPPTTDAARDAPTAAELPSCPDVGCTWAPGPMPGAGDTSGLWCVAVALNNPCYCIAPSSDPISGRSFSWCQPTPAQVTAGLTP